MTPIPGARAAPESVPLPAPLSRPHLADSTVWSKVRPYPALADWFNAEARSGRIMTCDVVVLEVLRSARNSDAFATQQRMLGLLPSCAITGAEGARALDVQRALADHGHHRGVPPADLLIAAAAEASSAPVLHYDHDYDLIAAVSGQPVRWLLPAGSLP